MKNFINDTLQAVSGGPSGIPKLLEWTSISTKIYSKRFLAM
jgi:hypothetical protein